MEWGGQGKKGGIHEILHSPTRKYLHSMCHPGRPWPSLVSHTTVLSCKCVM